MSVNDQFRKFAQKTATIVGTPATFAFAVFAIVTWAATGPMFGFSDTWQLVINTATTVITFLMVFVIQNTQNRDARAIHLKLDELIRANKHARNQLIDLEELSDEQLDGIHHDLCQLREVTEERLKHVRHIRQKKKS